MKKIGLCACYDTKNYGSMLQTLATCRQLEELGYDYEIIRYTRKATPDLILRSLKRIPEKLYARKEKAKQAQKIAKYPDIKAGIKKRNYFFEKFMNETFTKMSSAYDTFDQLTNGAQKYDAVLVGSDQLWRPEGYSTGFYNLLFVPDNITKISYATSFGVAKIPKNKQKIAKQFLNRIEHISVRELRASEMIKELTGRDVPTVVDPTLLFTGEKWSKIISPKKVVKDKYIFCYLLGSNPQHRRWVENLKKYTGYNIVTIPFLDEFVESDITFGDIQLFDVGPAEFINLIRNADYVCTDSFHGTVFSILNHKKFVTFNRFSEESKNSRNSRIESLLVQTGLESRRVTNNNTDIYSVIENRILYDSVEEKLDHMREKSVLYLLESLGHLK